MSVGKAQGSGGVLQPVPSLSLPTMLPTTLPGTLPGTAALGLEVQRHPRRSRSPQAQFPHCHL